MVTLADEQAIKIVNVLKGKVLFNQGDKGDAAYRQPLRKCFRGMSSRNLTRPLPTRFPSALRESSGNREG